MTRPTATVNPAETPTAPRECRLQSLPIYKHAEVFSSTAPTTTPTPSVVTVNPADNPTTAPQTTTTPTRTEVATTTMTLPTHTEATNNNRTRSEATTLSRLPTAAEETRVTALTVEDVVVMILRTEEDVVAMTPRTEEDAEETMSTTSLTTESFACDRSSASRKWSQSVEISQKAVSTCLFCHLLRVVISTIARRVYGKYFFWSVA